MLRKRQSTITEQYGPTFRRRVNPNYLQLSLRNARLVTEQERESPKRKGGVDYERMLERANQYLQSFTQNYHKINQIIDNVDESIRKRMEAHEIGLLSVVKSEIDKMQEDCRKVVSDYNLMLSEKNKETEIYHLRNEVDYFRNEALKLFQENKKLKYENESLIILLRNKDSHIDELNSALRRSTKKHMKYKILLEGKDLVRNLTQPQNQNPTETRRTFANEIKQSEKNMWINSNETKTKLSTNRYSICQSASSNHDNRNKLYVKRLQTEIETEDKKKKIRHRKTQSFYKFGEKF